MVIQDIAVRYMNVTRELVNGRDCGRTVFNVEIFQLAENQVKGKIFQNAQELLYLLRSTIQILITMVEPLGDIRTSPCNNAATTMR